MAIEIVTIAQKPALIPQIALWLWAEWARHKGRTLGMVTSRLEMRSVSGEAEQTFVVVDSGMPVATASFVVADLESRPDLTPWLASVFVDPPHRGRGHAVHVIRRVEEAARAARSGTLWLYTADAHGLYTKLGWETVGPELEHGTPVTLMRRWLS